MHEIFLYKVTELLSAELSADMHPVKKNNAISKFFLSLFVTNAPNKNQLYPLETNQVSIAYFSPLQKFKSMKSNLIIKLYAEGKNEVLKMFLNFYRVKFA